MSGAPAPRVGSTSRRRSNASNRIAYTRTSSSCELTARLTRLFGRETLALSPNPARPRAGPAAFRSLRARMGNTRNATPNVERWGIQAKIEQKEAKEANQQRHEREVTESTEKLL